MSFMQPLKQLTIEEALNVNINAHWKLHYYAKYTLPWLKQINTHNVLMDSSLLSHPIFYYSGGREPKRTYVQIKYWITLLSILNRLLLCVMAFQHFIICYHLSCHNTTQQLEHEGWDVLKELIHQQKIRHAAGYLIKSYYDNIIFQFLCFKFMLTYHILLRHNKGVWLLEASIH